jgi:hypothetical protein
MRAKSSMLRDRLARGASLRCAVGKQGHQSFAARRAALTLTTLGALKDISIARTLLGDLMSCGC